MKHLSTLLSTAAVLAFGAACCTSDDQTGNPQPIGLPAPAADRIFVTDTSGYVAGVGAAVPGAPDGTEVVVDVISGGASAQRYRSAVNADGSFLVEASFSSGQKLEIFAELGQQTGAKISIDVLPFDPLPTPLVVTDVSTATDGRATVSGTWRPNVDVIAGNRDRGSATSGKTDAAGAFSIAIEAAAGDRLVVFGRGSGGFVERQVP